MSCCRSSALSRQTEWRMEKVAFGQGEYRLDIFSSLPALGVRYDIINGYLLTMVYELRYIERYQ